MSEYKSEVKGVDAPAAVVYERLSNLENLRALIDKLPEDQIPADKLEQLRQMTITPDTISVPGGPAGNVTLRVVSREPHSLIAFKAADVPLDLNLEIRIGGEDGQAGSTIQVAVVADIPMMLRPMVKGPLNQMVGQFADMLASINYAAMPRQEA